MRSYNVKEKPVVSAVSEILQYIQTDTHTQILLLLYMDFRTYFLMVDFSYIIYSIHYHRDEGDTGFCKHVVSLAFKLWALLIGLFKLEVSKLFNQ